MPGKVEFETPPNLKSSEFAEMMSGIERNYMNELESKVNVTFFLPKEDNYITQEMYMPDIEVNVKGELNGDLLYNPTRIAFIGY